MSKRRFGQRVGSRMATRRGFLAGAAAAGAVGIAGASLFAPRPSTAQVGIAPQSTGRTGSRYVIRGGSVMTMDGGEFAQADVVVEGTKIVAVGPNAGAGAGGEVIDATGRIVMPGFIDTHHHQFETALRSFLADGVLILDGDAAPGPNGTPGEGAYAYFTSILLGFAPVYRPQDVYISELFGGLSQLDDGVTTVHDVSQIHHTPEHSDAAVKALFDTGRRAAFGYFEGAGQGMALKTKEYAYPDDATRIHDKYFRSDDQLVHMIMGGEVYLGPETAQKSWAIGRKLGIQIAAHILSPFGIRPIFDNFAQGKGGTGDTAIGPDNLFIHMTGMSDMAWDVVKDKGAHVSVACPIEMNMRHGMPPILKLQSLGMEPSLSVDVECTLTADFFTQMRSMMNLQRLLVNQMVLDGNSPPNSVDWGLPPDQPQWPSWPGTGSPPKPAAAPLTTRDVLRFATINGAKALRLDGKTGSLTPGKEADIIILDATRINVFPVNQVPGAVVSLMDRTNVETVIVAGKVRKWKGTLLDADLPKLRRELERSRDYIFAHAFNNSGTLFGGGNMSGLKTGIPVDVFRAN
jgi:cytosine/adenosine deaminase-related metal-dependent hydrolase